MIRSVKEIAWAANKIVPTDNMDFPCDAAIVLTPIAIHTVGDNMKILTKLIMIADKPRTKPGPYAKAARAPAIIVSHGPMKGIMIETIASTRAVIPKLFCMVFLQNFRTKNRRHGAVIRAAKRML
jgi:hypothetical protein